jgi:hypothetical protein
VQWHNAAHVATNGSCPQGPFSFFPSFLHSLSTPVSSYSSEHPLSPLIHLCHSCSLFFPHPFLYLAHSVSHSTSFHLQAHSMASFDARRPRCSSLNRFFTHMETAWKLSTSSTLVLHYETQEQIQARLDHFSSPRSDIGLNHRL